MRFFLLAIYIFLISSCSFSPKPSSIDIKIDPKQLSYIIYDLEQGKIKDSFNANKILIPASLFKLFTAYAVLESFDHNQRFATKIYMRGKVNNGVLEGDLIIVGGGDPSLQYKDLYNIAALIKDNNISKVTGRLFYYEGSFLTKPEINKKQPLARYNPGFSGLLLRDNSFLLRKTTSSQKVISIPKLDYMDFKIVPFLQQVKYLNNNNWLVGKNTQYRLPVKNSSYFVTKNFQKILQYNGIKISWGGKLNSLADSSLLLEHKSNNLVDILYYNLLYSHNLTSEILLLHFSNQISCEYNSLNEAAKCLNSWYENKFPNQEWRGLFWENGSGLSAQTNITTIHMLLILKEIYNNKYGDRSVVSLLPIAGLTGTLNKRFNNESLQIWAKTGNMHFVSGLAGYLFKDNSRYAFVILANDKDKRSKLDNLLDQDDLREEYYHLLKEAKIWKNSIYNLQQEIISQWLLNQRFKISDYDM